MGCPTEVEIGTDLVFTVVAHNQSTGALADADAAPAYRVYEEETGTAILTGTMAKLDDANTLGFYSESIACTVGNGFEDNKTYSIYITVVVSSVTFAITYGFRARTALENLSAADVNAQLLDVLSVDTFAQPGQGTPPATTTLLVMIQYLYKFYRNLHKDNKTAGLQELYNDDGVTVDQKATVSDDGTIFTKGEVITGP